MNAAYLDRILKDTIAEIGGEVRVEQYWTDPRLYPWFANHVEARRVGEVAIAAWMCQQGKKQLNDANPPYWVA